MRQTSAGRQPLLPTSAKHPAGPRSRGRDDEAKVLEPCSTPVSQGLSMQQACFYLAMLMLGMMVAFMMEPDGQASASAQGSKMSLYGLLAPSSGRSGAQKPAVRVIDPPAAAKLMQQVPSPEKPPEDPPPQEPELEAVLPNVPEAPKEPESLEADVDKAPEGGSQMAAIIRTPITDLWASPKSFKHTELQRCSNSCPTAHNGVCEDGTADLRDGETAKVTCDLGTDCEDCGGSGWHGKATGSLKGAAVEGTMIRDLADEGTEVMLRKTTCPPHFTFAYTNPQHDVDVSAHVHHAGVFERDITYIWYRVLAQRCKDGDLVVDVGGNFGWYTVFAASLGCRVVTWEPVPRFRAFLLYNVLLNGVGHLVEIRDTVIANTNVPQTVVVPQRGIWGTAGIGGLNIDPAIDNEGSLLKVVSVPERLDDVIQQQAALLKVDVEGYEPDVFETARRLLSERKIDHIMMEYSPGVGERQHNWTFTKRFPVMLRDIIRSGYTMRSFDTPGMRVPSVGEWEEIEENGEPASAIPALELVLEENIKYDILDMDNAPGFACVFKPPEVRKMRMHSNCAAIPEGFHPMSFHSVFSHNTNVWALRADKDVYPKGPVTGVIKPYEDEHGFFTTRESAEGPRGMGGRVCPHLPPEVQVHHRCRCTKPEKCGEEEKAVEEAYRTAQTLASTQR